MPNSPEEIKVEKVKSLILMRHWEEYVATCSEEDEKIDAEIKKLAPELLVNLANMMKETNS